MGGLASDLSSETRLLSDDMLSLLVSGNGASVSTFQRIYLVLTHRGG